MWNLTKIHEAILTTNNSKLADWDDDDPSAITDTSSRWDKVVILKHMFNLQELEVCNLFHSWFTSCVITDLATAICRRIQQQYLTSKKTYAKNAPS